MYNTIRAQLGLGTTNYFAMANAFKPMYILSGLWQNMGWDSILYIAALAGVDPALYEAATIDGASRMQKIRYISIPSIMGTITIMSRINNQEMVFISRSKEVGSS